MAWIRAVNVMEMLSAASENRIPETLMWGDVCLRTDNAQGEIISERAFQRQPPSGLNSNQGGYRAFWNKEKVVLKTTEKEERKFVEVGRDLGERRV